MLLTAKDTEADIVLGLEAGADDYLIKPFSVLEFRARVKALLRRGQSLHDNNQQLNFNGVSINATTREVTAFDNPLELTAREFDLLLFCPKTMVVKPSNMTHKVKVVNFKSRRLFCLMFFIL